MIALPGCDAAAFWGQKSATEGCAILYKQLTGRVMDYAGLLQTKEEADLTGVLMDLEHKTKHQFVVATVPSLGGQSIETFGRCHGNQWGVGRKKEDDGVILFVAPTERKVRIEVAYGLKQELTDAEAKTIIDEALLPSFKKGDFAKGIQSGVSAIIAEIGAE